MSKRLKVRELIKMLQTVDPELEVEVSEASEWPIDYSAPTTHMTVIRWPGETRPDLP
jgi:hypothetical protein